MEREAEKLLEGTRANARDPEGSGASQEEDDDRIGDWDEADPYDEVIFGRRRPESVAIEWTSKTVYVLEFKRTSDQRHNYREQGEPRARPQHDVLVKRGKRRKCRMNSQTDHLRGGHMWIRARTNIQ